MRRLEEEAKEKAEGVKGWEPVDSKQELYVAEDQAVVARKRLVEQA